MTEGFGSDERLWSILNERDVVSLMTHLPWRSLSWARCRWRSLAIWPAPGRWQMDW